MPLPLRRLAFATLVLGLAVASRPSTTAEPTPYKPFNLGSHHRAVSTRSPEAQLAFDQGLIWAFAFNHDEAERAFLEAARQDPKLAMAYWGVALVNGPHINNPTVDEAHAKAAWEALENARSRLEGASEAERALIEALASRYASPQPADRAPLDAAYAKAMGNVYRRFSKDADVAALYAEALMDEHPWEQWTREGTAQPGTKAVLKALEDARRLSPNHPGALHLTIHALEASPRPQDARDAADRLRGLVPDASHLVHMPAHIDVRLGQWSQAAAANERAMEADARYRERTKTIGFYNVYIAHNAHFLAYTAMMEGRSAVALQATEGIVKGLSPEALKESPLFLDAFQTVRWEAQKRFGRWEDILKESVPAPELPVAKAYGHFVRAVAHAALGHVEDAVKEQTAFASSLPNVPKDAFWGANAAADVLGVAVPYLDGEIAYRKGDLTQAVTRLREAVRKEDELKYDEPPAWTVPSRHALGAVLLQAKRFREAEEVYREDLLQYPENGWALVGLADALAGQKKTGQALEARARLKKAWSRADIELPGSCLCIAPANAKGAAS